MIDDLLQREISFFDNKFFVFTRVSRYATKIFDHHLKHVLEHLDETDRILDIGCNDGRHTSFLRKKGYKVFGVDVSKGALKRRKDSFFSFGEHIEKDNLRNSFLCADARHPPFKGNTFDKILILETLHHIPDKEMFLRSLSKIMKDNGRIIISEPNPQNLLRKFVSIIGSRFELISPYELPLTFDKLIKIVEKHFEIEKAFLYLTPISILSVFLYEMFLRITGYKKSIKLVEKLLSMLDKINASKLGRTENLRLGRWLMWRVFVVARKKNLKPKDL